MLNSNARYVIVWHAVIDCFVGFDTDEICIDPRTWLSVFCSLLSSPVAASRVNSSVMSFAFQLRTGDIVTCESSHCHCAAVNETAVRLSCQYLPTNYDNATLSCYFRDDPSISVQAPVHVRGNVRGGLASKNLVLQFVGFRHNLQYKMRMQHNPFDGHFPVSAELTSTARIFLSKPLENAGGNKV